MKKGHIRILVIVISIALVGLLAVQWFWVRNAIEMRERQFHNRVGIALHRVSERLQDREISLAITDGRMLGLPFMPAPEWERGRKDDRFRHGGPPPFMVQGTMPPMIKREHFQTRQMVNGKPITTQNTRTSIVAGGRGRIYDESTTNPETMQYMRGFLERMLQGNRPIQQRINFSLLDTLLRFELAHHEISEPYVFGIGSEGPLPEFLRVANARSPVDHERRYYRAHLFPHDLQPSEYYLEVQFPKHSNPTLRAMGLVLPTSGILILIVMVCFGIALVAFRRQQKMSNLKTDFINNMTHELKTPISTISLALEALGDPDMQSPERIAMYAKVIGQENERLKGQVERVLQAAALERGELSLHLEPVDVDLALCEQIERIRLHVENRGGKIRYQPDATNTTILADEVHFGGMLFNLLDNAVKYSPAALEIEVVTKNVGGGISIAVTDHGLGISSEAQKNVFEKFYRVPTGNVHDVKGFGIGLSYARSMSKAHGGDITLVSELGKGSTFTIFIPQKTNLQ